MTLGITQRLKAARETENGMYFTDGESEVLLPRSEVPAGWGPGVEASLFLYRDSEDRPTVTRRKPAAERGQAAVLTVVDVGAVGAFASWGLLKDLLIPRSEQAVPLSVGQKVLVLVLVDEATDRLYGTTKLTSHLSRDLSPFRLGQQVTCQVWKLHERGWTVLVDHRWQGLVYRNEWPAPLKPGEALTGWVANLRDDGKLDIRLRPQGFTVANPDARQRIIEALTKSGGRLGLGDKSDSDDIQAVLGLSKRAFKAACGSLLKDGVIRVSSDAIERIAPAT